MKSQPKEDMKSIALDISDDVFLKLAMQAHERNVTLNTHIIDVIKDKLKNSEYQFENGTKPQLLTEKQT
jgi:macrodomain Ter protein organizer (MatP/YcbG family)